MNIKEEILALCYELASRSPDKSNQNGAVLISDNDEIISGGLNKFPDNVEVNDDLLSDRDKKLFYIEHAERNAIFSAVKNNKIVSGQRLVCPWFACSDCARAIILTGVEKVIGHKQRMDQTPERWVKSVNAGLDLLKLHGVELEFIDVNLGCTPIIVNGQSWQP